MGARKESLKLQMYMLKRLRYRSPYELWMFVVVALSVFLRFILIYFHHPVTNSDEGNMGLVALHIAFNGDHPAFFYGLPYLGPIEGYLAAPLFHIFGPSVFTLRLALLPFHAGFLIAVYYLVRLLYTDRFALASVVLLSLGSQTMIWLQIMAVGEYPEIEMFAALICLLTLSLALSSHLQSIERKKRIVLYGALGLIIGVAIWVDFLIGPFIAMGLLLLCLFCRRELLRWCGLSLLLGIIIGAFPLIYYNLTAPFDQNSWNILLFIHHGGANLMAAQHMTWLNQLSGTVMISLPLATGASPGCPVNAFPPPFGTPTSTTLPCVLFNAVWGVGYLVLLGIAFVTALLVIWRYVRSRRHALPDTAAQDTVFEKRQEMIRGCGRLVILVSVIVTIGLYAISASAAVYADSAYRYLALAILAIPILLWPLWQGLNQQKNSLNRHLPGKAFISGALLLLVAATFLVGMARTFQQIPADQAYYNSEQGLIRDLLRVGATRIYSDYWTCNRLIFDTREKIICIGVGPNMKPGFNRYSPYIPIVQAAPHPTYVFPSGSPLITALQQHVASSHVQYKEYRFDGYVVYVMT